MWPMLQPLSRRMMTSTATKGRSVSRTEGTNVVQKRFSATRRRRLLAPGLAAAVTAGALAIGPAPAQANPGDIGYACGYYSNVSLFGGPYGSMGCGTQTSSYASANSASPSVSAD